MRILVAGILLLLGVSTAMAETRDAHQYFFDATMGDLKSELATAKKEGKKGIVIMYELEDCPFCSRMKQNILNQSEVQDYYHQHFLIFPVNIKNDVDMVDFKGKATTEKAFGLEQRIYGTPVFDFFDLDGKPMARFPGAAKDVNEFMLLGRYVAEGAYKTMPFVAFKRQEQAAAK